MNAQTWNRRVNRHLTAWTGATMDAFPAYDFTAAQADGVLPGDAAQAAIDIQGWADDQPVRFKMVRTIDGGVTLARQI